MEECRSTNAKAHAAETGLWNGNGQICRLEALNEHVVDDATSRPLHYLVERIGMQSAMFQVHFRCLSNVQDHEQHGSPILAYGDPADGDD